LSDRDSVFASDEAQDLCLWLRGVAEPQDMRRVRAALGTRTVGLSLPELYELATQDELLDQRAEQMRELHQTWQNQGVLAMLRQSLHVLQLAGRWRGEPDGERRLTNVLHLAELLQTASHQLDGEQALIRWLSQQIDEALDGSAGENEEQTVRLESDEDLVKVITIHKSKGLEYPVVCLPFAHSHRVVTADKAAVLQVSDAQGERHWTLAFDKQDAKGADLDRLREDLRLWYVALTRARHALWVGWSPVKRGNGKTCVNHDSAPGHLLGGGQPLEAAQWLPPLQALQTTALGAALSVHLTLAPSVVPLTRWQRPAQHTALQDALHSTARIDKSWTIASFSRLTRDLSSQPVLQSALHMATPRPADDEPVVDEVALPASAVLAPWHSFARGPSAGNFLHDQLEWLAADHFALQPGTPQAERLAKRCERAGYKAQAADVVQWLARVVAQPLRGPDAPLNALGTLLPEMEFWLPAARLHAKEVDALCRQHLLPGVSRPQLPDAQLHGMLMGFADLVFEHEGRYWVLDYKSNHLGEGDAAYTAPALDAAMAHHRYEVQAALYMLALHRLLRARLGDAYDPAAQLGGAVYLFLRGIDGPAGGCCTLPAPVALLDALDAMMTPEEAA
jgi:exodeoxyribonuclease V beta subunit